jgi:hypothetical protein
VILGIAHRESRRQKPLDFATPGLDCHARDGGSQPAADRSLGICERKEPIDPLKRFASYGLHNAPDPGPEVYPQPYSLPPDPFDFSTVLLDYYRTDQGLQLDFAGLWG